MENLMMEKKDLANRMMNVIQLFRHHEKRMTLQAFQTFLFVYGRSKDGQPVTKSALAQSLGFALSTATRMSEMLTEEGVKDVPGSRGMAVLEEEVVGREHFLRVSRKGEFIMEQISLIMGL